MTVSDILPVLNENKPVVLVENGAEVSRYDGKNSVDEEFGTYYVMDIYCNDKEIMIEIKK